MVCLPEIKTQYKKPWEKSGDDFQINLDYYTHLSIVESLQSIHKGLSSGNDKAGFISLILAIDQLEQICRARGLVDEEFESALKDKAGLFAPLPSDSETDKLLKQAKQANFKLGLLLRLVFDSTAKDVELTL